MPPSPPKPSGKHIEQILLALILMAIAIWGVSFWYWSINIDKIPDQGQIYSNEMEETK